MKEKRPPDTSDPSQLFTVRVWRESVQDGSTKVRVQVKHVLSGATQTFREWSQVIAFIVEKVRTIQVDLRDDDNQC